MRPGPFSQTRAVEALKRAVRGLSQALPILTAVLLLVGLVTAWAPRGLLRRLFTGGLFDPVIGAAAGSVAAGNPITSYVIGGELLGHGVSLVAVTAFLVAWVTVGLVQLPAESTMLGRRFAVVRNIVSFLLAILVAVLTVTTLEVLR